MYFWRSGADCGEDVEDLVAVDWSRGTRHLHNLNYAGVQVPHHKSGERELRGRNSLDPERLAPVPKPACHRDLGIN